MAQASNSSKRDSLTIPKSRAASTPVHGSATPRSHQTPRRRVVSYDPDLCMTSGRRDKRLFSSPQRTFSKWQDPEELSSPDSELDNDADADTSGSSRRRASFIRSLSHRAVRLRAGPSPAHTSRANHASYGRSERMPECPSSPESASQEERFPPNVRWYQLLLHPEAPLLLMRWLQFIFNAVMLASVFYLAWLFVSTVSNDIDLKVDEYSADILNEIEVCTREYIQNKCEPGQRVPAAEEACAGWEACMSRDPRKVGRARVSAETFGGIVNSFIAPIGFKSMLGLICLFVGTLYGVNTVLNQLASPNKSNSSAHSRDGGSTPTMPPATPQIPPSTPYRMMPVMMDFQSPHAELIMSPSRRR